MLKKIRKFWGSLGSGLITGAADNDPSGIATYSVAGARSGFSLLWSLVFIIPLMVAIQEMSARIGALSGCGLIGNIKKYYPPWLLLIVAISIVTANAFNIGADIYGMAGAINILLPINIQVLAIITSIIVLALMITLSYSQIVSIFKWLSLSLFAYVFAFVAVQYDWLIILKNAFIPHIHWTKEYLVILFAIMGTTLSPYLYFWQASEEAEETQIKNPRVKVCHFRAIRRNALARIEWDTKFGMLFSNFVSFFILALLATVVFNAGTQNIATLREAAEALRPLAGGYAYLLFTAGILGSGLLAIPVLAGSAGYVLAEMFNWKASLNYKFFQAKEFYVAIIFSVLIGLLIPFLGITPIQALFYSAILNGLIAPLLILMIIHMASNPAIVGINVSRPVIHYLGHVSFILMTLGIFTLFIH